MSLFNFTGNNNLTLKNIVDGKKRSLVNVFGLVQSKLLQLKENYDIGVSFQLEAVRLSYSLLSMDKAPFPDIKFADNLATKMAKIADIQADFPSIQLNIYHKKANFNKTDLIAVIPIQNKGIVGYADLLKPYLTTGDVKLLGEEDELLVSVSLNGQNIGNDDWLQIEVDYVCVVSGIEKPKEVNKFTTGELLERGFIAVRTGGIVTVDHNDVVMPFYAQVLNDLKLNTIHFSGFNVTNLSGLLSAKDIVEDIFVNNCDNLNNSVLESNIKLFPKLKRFRSFSTSRNTVNWASIINELLELKELLLAVSGLTTTQADEICIAFDATGRTYGLLDLSGNNGVSVTSETARNNLTTKGWTLTF